MSKKVLQKKDFERVYNKCQWDYHFDNPFIDPRFNLMHYDISYYNTSVFFIASYRPITKILKIQRWMIRNVFEITPEDLHAFEHFLVSKITDSELFKYNTRTYFYDTVEYNLNDNERN